MRKTIRGHPNYKVSDDGHIYNKDGHQMRYKLDKDGYCIVRITENRQVYHLKLHRIVAEHFIPNPDGLPQVNHNDGNKENCAVYNLEWCTDSDNTKHSYDTGLHKVPDVIQMTIDGVEIARYSNANIAEEKTGIKAHNIRVAMSRGTLSGGYKWRRDK